MIRGGFLSAEDRSQLIALARDGSAVSRMTRRANALVLLDDGWSCQQVARALLLNDDTIRDWLKLFEQRGIEGLTSFDMGGSASFLSAAQENGSRSGWSDRNRARGGPREPSPRAPKGRLHQGQLHARQRLLRPRLMKGLSLGSKIRSCQRNPPSALLGLPIMF